jgi:DNA polymerase III, gamma/tau subunits
MEYILKEINVEFEEDALLLIAKAAEGGMRDGLSILDQALSFHDNQILTEDIQQITGSVTQDLLEDYFESLAEKDTKNAFRFTSKSPRRRKRCGTVCGRCDLIWTRFIAFSKTHKKIIAHCLKLRSLVKDLKH